MAVDHVVPHSDQVDIRFGQIDLGVKRARIIEGGQFGAAMSHGPWANEDREISGNVTEIAPAAQVKSYGTIVRVEASIPHADETLRPAMTGYAKIDGESMRVWQAFLRRIIQIVRVEFWSWIP